jgi:lipopolysaccharide/colanic/teichoic acid biosynthesis glycosyltransferase
MERIIVVLAPILLSLAAAIYFVGGRPVLVSEVWIDRRGNSVALLAFRTNGVRFDSSGQRVPVPWIGSFLRRTSLDKLPRWWNVLKGHCNVDALWF